MDTVKSHGESPQVGGCVKGGGGCTSNFLFVCDENVCKLEYKIYYAENELVFYDARSDISWSISNAFYFFIQKALGVIFMILV